MTDPNTTYRIAVADDARTALIHADAAVREATEALVTAARQWYAGGSSIVLTEAVETLDEAEDRRLAL